MSKHTKTKTQLLTFILFASILFTSATTLYTAKAAETTTDLKLNLAFQANNGTIINSTQQPTFAPFDLIQLIANLTNGNATVPQSTIVFNVEGPSSASYRTEIVLSAETDKTGTANISFRIPLEETEKKVNGKWQVHVNVKTSNGTLQQAASFQIAWPVQNLSINFLDSQGHSQSVFNPNDTLKAVIAFNSNQSQTQNINFTVLDTLGNVLTHKTQDISTNATGKNEIFYEFKIPENSALGVASANLSIYAGTYQNVSIPVAQNKIAYFSIGNSTTPPPDPPSPTPTPISPTPIPLVENTLSLFSWLIVATGFFTFTLLVLFLKRKNPKIRAQIPIQPLTPSMPQVTSDSTHLNAREIITQTEASSIIEQMNATNAKLTPQESITLHLSGIASATQRIQDLKVILKEQTDQLNKEILQLNQILQRQEDFVRNYFDGIRLEVKKAQDAVLSDSTTDQSSERTDDTKK
jgi:hypothetical protein